MNMSLLFVRFMIYHSIWRRWRWNFFTFNCSLRSLRSSSVQLLKRCIVFSIKLLTSLLISLGYRWRLRFKSRWRWDLFGDIFLYIKLILLLFFSIYRGLVSYSTLRWRRHHRSWFNHLMLLLFFIKNWRSWHILIFSWNIRIWWMLLT